MDPAVLHSEIRFKTSRSGGSGGQNVNKVSTKVELNFHVSDSAYLDDAQKEMICRRLSARLTNEGVLQIIAQSERSQLANKRLALARFDELIASALKPVKKRKTTRISKAVKEKRLAAKKKRSELKQQRREDSF